MTWQEVIDDQTLQDLPYKIELNEFGQIVMSPASNQHSRYQGRIARHLEKLIPDGEVVPECSVETERGVKVPDVAWLSAEFLAAHGDETPFTRAPDICVEVMSPSNSARELKLKTALYFQQGAREVWGCDSMGTMRFHSAAGQMARSAIIPDFPVTV